MVNWWVEPGVMEVMLLGLESHLKNIVETAIDVAKYRKNKYTNDNYIPYIKPNEDAQNISNENALPSSKDITLLKICMTHWKCILI